MRNAIIITVFFDVKTLFKIAHLVNQKCHAPTVAKERCTSTVHRGFGSQSVDEKTLLQIILYSLRLIPVGSYVANNTDWPRRLKSGVDVSR